MVDVSRVISDVNAVTWNTLTPSIDYSATTALEVFHVYPASFDYGGNSTFIYDGNAWNVQEFINTVHSKSKKCYLAVGGYLGTNSGSGNFPMILADHSLRDIATKWILRELQVKGYNGVVLDVEGSPVANDATNWSNYMTWLSEIKTAIEAANPNYYIGWDVYARGWKIEQGEPYADKIHVMLYSNRFAYDPATYLPAYASRIGGNKAKLLAGIKIEYETTTSLAEKLDYVKTNGYGGFFFWNNRTLSQSFYDVIKRYL